MTDYVADAVELLREAGRLPDGAAKVALHERAIGLADEHGDDALGFAVRSDSLWPLYHGRQADLLLVHFSWCLAYHDRTPAAPRFDLLWQYRWVVDTLPGFDTISRAQIDATWGDLRDRYAADGYSLRPAYLLRRRICMKMGDAPGADAADAAYHKAGRDTMSDNADTDAAFEVDYRAFRRDDAKTLAAGKPFFAGKLTDPHHTIHFVDDILPTLIRRRMFAEAADWHKKAVRLVRDRPAFYGVPHHLLVPPAVTGDLAGGVRLFDQHFAPALSRPGVLTHVGMMKVGLFLARRLVAANRAYLSLKVGDAPVPGAVNGRCRPGVLADWLETALPEVCRLADARNGTTHFTTHLADLDDWAAAADYAGGGT